MQITIDRLNKAPIYLQIKNQIKVMIFSGVLPAYYLLPPERELAKQLEVNRSTVLNAYRELKAEGLIDAHIGRGTQVMPLVEEKKEQLTQSVYPLPWQYLMSQESLKGGSSAMGNVIEMSSRERMISFAAGIAAPEFYPIEDIAAMKDLFETYHEEPLLHTPVEGLYGLREKISQMMASRQMYVKPEEIIVLSGSQQGLDIIGRIFIQPGDVVVVDEPTYIGAIQLFKSIGAKIISVPMTDAGMRMDMLERVLTKHKPKMIYTQPSFQNPTGKVMSLEHRLKLLELSYRYQVPILEDDAYSMLRYQGEDLPTLKSLDKHDYVLYLNTFSKILFPGIRVGWLSAPKEVIRQFALKKQMMDLHANSLGQWLLYSYISKEKMNQHLEKIKYEYKQRKNAMVEALRDYAPAYVKWEEPEGGFYVWCELPESFDAGKIWMKSAEQGVVFVIGDVFYANQQGTNCFRLNFTKHSVADIRRGIEILMRVIQQMEPSTSIQNTLSIDLNPMF